MAVVPMLPPPQIDIESVIVKVVQDWEDIHRKFDEQLIPPG
jgi:hypothetical protein